LRNGRPSLAFNANGTPLGARHGRLQFGRRAGDYFLKLASSRWFSGRKIIVILRLLKRLFAPKLFGPRMLADPYPYYARLRSTAPLSWWTHFGACGLPHSADVTAVLRSAPVSPDRPKKTPQQAGPESPALTEARAFSMLNADPPRHTRLRLLVNKAFTP